LIDEISLPLNLEMAATEEMLEIALNHRPNACCLVPEKREELTTEGGLDVAGGHNHLAPYVARLRDAGIRVSLFVDPDETQLAAAGALKADIVELHTGAYCEQVLDETEKSAESELERLRGASRFAAGLGLEVHAGHGLTFDTVGPVAAIPELVELNIGHFLVGEAIYIGLEDSIRQMRDLMDDARADA
ncbi:MAG: pyridoxine 5'-phosphate synthase, partial [Methyloligellaceae bacterium]